MVKKKTYRCIVKRRNGICENYDERKLYASVYAACYVVHMDRLVCEKTADVVAKKISKTVQKLKEVESKFLRKEVIKELRKHNKDAAFMYKTHEDIG